MAEKEIGYIKTILRVRTRGVLSALLFVFMVLAIEYAEAKQKRSTETAKDTAEIRADELEEIVIEGKKTNIYLRSKETGQITMDKRLIEIMPQVMGNTDPMRVAQLMPGVGVNSEYEAGLHVEGGESSHCAIMADGVRIYNPNHLLGLFSTFNPGHFSDMTLCKNTFWEGTADAIGGELRMTSIETDKFRDTITRERGKRIGGEASVGPMSSQGTLTTKIGKRTEMKLSARQSYLNLLYGSLLRIDDASVEYTFGDYNATIGIDLTERDRILMQGYFGWDDAKLIDDNTTSDIFVKWKNYMGQMQYAAKRGESVFTNSLYLTHYDNFLSYKEDKLYAVMPSRIDNYGYKFEMKRKRFDLIATCDYMDVSPQSPEVKSGRSIETKGAERQRAVLGSARAYKTFLLPKDVRLRAQLRGSVYGIDGKGHPTLDPSLSVQREFGKDGKAPAMATISVGQMHQHLFQTGFSNMGLPTEFWIVADEKRRAQSMRGVSADYEQRFYDSEYKMSVSAYYRLLYNQVEYAGDLMSLITDEYNLDNQLMQGKGKNYGVSVMLQRTKGNLVGWISYEYSRSFREFEANDEGMFKAGKYPSAQDRPHQLNVVLTYRYKKRWDAGASFVFASGKPFTSPKSIFAIDGKLLTTYKKYNASRLPMYMRLDLSGNYFIRQLLLIPKIVR